MGFVGMDDCIFCKITRREEWSARVYEDDEHLAFMDIYPMSIGHMLVIPKRHYRDIFEMDLESVSRLFGVAGRLAGAVKRALNAGGVRLIQNNGAVAGQIVFHVHVHIIPMSLGEGLVGRHKAGREELLSVAERIKEYL